MDKLTSSMYDSAAYSRNIDGSSSQSAGPLAKVNSTWIISIWVILIIASSLFKAAMASYPSLQYAYALGAAASFILLSPGILIFPLAIGLINGIKIGDRSGSIRRAINASLYSGIYNCLIFTVAIIVVYEIMLYASMLPVTSFIVEYWIVLPLLILLALPATVSVATYMNKKSFEDMAKR